MREEFRALQKINAPCACESQFKRRCARELLDTQVWALHEIRDVGGLLGPISVGDGKTLLDLLAPMVIPDCRVAVLLIPPQLRAQLSLVDWSFYGQHWELPNLGSGTWFVPGRPMLHVVAYSELSSARNTDILERIRPDLVIADEAHLIRNATAARTKRFRRYFAAHPETRLCCWSGTLTTKSIRDYAHLAALALGEGSPAPLHWPTVEEWAGAIDPSDWPSDIGDLRQICRPGEHVREGYRRRLLDTRGVVGSTGVQSCPASLTLSERKTVSPQEVAQHLGALYGTWTRPDGEELTNALDVHRCAKEISSGFFYHWIWPRGESLEVREKWLQVRKEWHCEIREKLKTAREFLDSPLLLTEAAIRWEDGYAYIRRDPHGRELERAVIPPHTASGPRPTWKSATWLRWREVRDTAKPETEGVWIDEWLANDAADWCSAETGICWYEHDFFGQRVAEISCLPIYGAGKEAAEELLRVTGDHSIIASIRANSVGKNLQMFSRNLVANLPSNGATWEQLLGRTHRQGQLADEITVDLYQHTAALVEALQKAKMQAQYIQDTIGGSQKLNQATYTF